MNPHTFIELASEPIKNADVIDAHKTAPAK